MLHSLTSKFPSNSRVLCLTFFSCVINYPLGQSSKVLSNILSHLFEQISCDVYRSRYYHSNCSVKWSIRKLNNLNRDTLSALNLGPKYHLFPFFFLFLDRIYEIIWFGYSGYIVIVIIQIFVKKCVFSCLHFYTCLIF